MKRATAKKLSTTASTLLQRWSHLAPRTIGVVTAALSALAVLWWQTGPQEQAPSAPSTSQSSSGRATPGSGGQAALPSGSIAWSQLPPQAHTTYGMIRQGGPFPYEQDGTTFFNREGLLPNQPRGYYREYTVDTPSLDHRGARRIVCGGEAPAQPVDCYYTSDHYSSFSLIEGEAD